MFHLLFVPHYLDYVPTDLGGLLRPVTKLSGRAFSFHSLSISPPLSPSNTHYFFSLLVIHPPFFPILWHPITGPNPFFPFFSSIHPSIFLPPSVLLSSLSSAFHCSVLTLSSLPHVLLQAYSVLDVEFYCHSVYTGTLWFKAPVTTSTIQATVTYLTQTWQHHAENFTGISSASELMLWICSLCVYMIFFSVLVHRPIITQIYNSHLNNFS